MSILCWIALHDWKPVMRQVSENPLLQGRYFMRPGYSVIALPYLWADLRFRHVANKCTKCGKRRSS